MVKLYVVAFFLHQLGGKALAMPLDRCIQIGCLIARYTADTHQSAFVSHGNESQILRAIKKRMERASPTGLPSLANWAPTLKPKALRPYAIPKRRTEKPGLHRSFPFNGLQSRLVQTPLGTELG